MSRSTHMHTACDFLHYNNTADVDNMSKILADNFTSTIRPATLGVPVVGKQPYLDRMKAAGISYGLAMPKPEDIMETSDALVFYTNANGTTASGFPWINEYIFRIRFDNQDKIASVDDSRIPQLFWQLLLKKLLQQKQSISLRTCREDFFPTT